MFCIIYFSFYELIDMLSSNIKFSLIDAFILVDRIINIKLL